MSESVIVLKEGRWTVSRCSYPIFPCWCLRITFFTASHVTSITFSANHLTIALTDQPRRYSEIIWRLSWCLSLNFDILINVQLDSKTYWPTISNMDRTVNIYNKMILTRYLGVKKKCIFITYHHYTCQVSVLAISAFRLWFNIEQLKCNEFFFLKKQKQYINKKQIKNRNKITQKQEGNEKITRKIYWLILKHNFVNFKKK
jgi:hypothetical protein